MTAASEETSRNPRPVRAAPDEPIEVAFVVNGTTARLRVPARLTLADALRDHMGLTGTHVGCEHGVCGMCTVLVDGQAVRSCLMFAVQAEGAEILTVEGLGRPDTLHPLQESFGRNHALQCGFCTPGFLMSSYDLLSNRPGTTDSELPAELSGVLCRCTGYRNILTAVREVRRDYPDGVPAPTNCGRRALIGRAAAPEVSDRTEPGGGDDVAATVDTDIVLPAGEPTISVRVDTEIVASIDEVWRVLRNERMLARCLPGAELTEELGGGRFAGRARVSVGPIKLTLHGVAHIVERDRHEQRMHVIAQGRDSGGTQTQADIVLSTESTRDGSILRADARLYLTGRIAQFGRALAGDVSRRMFEQFGAAVEQSAVSGDTSGLTNNPPSVIVMIAHTIAARTRTFLRGLAHNRPR